MSRVYRSLTLSYLCPDNTAMHKTYVNFAAKIHWMYSILRKVQTCTPTIDFPIDIALPTAYWFTNFLYLYLQVCCLGQRHKTWCYTAWIGWSLRRHRRPSVVEWRSSLEVEWICSLRGAYLSYTCWPQNQIYKRVCYSNSFSHHPLNSLQS